MKNVLGKKLTTPNDQFIEVFKNIEDYVSQNEVEEATKKAIEKILLLSNGKEKIGVAWSGGKDSLVVADLVKKSGIKSISMFAHTEFEYPAFLDWCMKHKPKDSAVYNLGFPLEWFANHQNYVFCTGKERQFIREHTNRAATKKFFFDKNLELEFCGHRVIDGNFCGKNGILVTKKGEVHANVIFDWSHELVLAYIRYNNIELPPIYDWAEGFINGTHPIFWRYPIHGILKTWREVYSIDKSIVEKSANAGIKTAIEFMENLKCR